MYHRGMRAFGLGLVIILGTACAKKPAPVTPANGAATGSATEPAGSTNVKRTDPAATAPALSPTKATPSGDPCSGGERK
jgi:hypothetical protein